VKTYEPLDGEKTFQGKLIAFHNGYLTLECKVKTKKIEKEIPYDKVANARLAVEF
jgi:ribosome maturation factor RimP